MTRRIARAIQRLLRADPLVNEAAAGRRIAELVGGADRGGRGVGGVLVARMDHRERAARADLVAEADELGQPDGMVDRILGARPAAAERHDRKAERARIDGGDDALAHRA